MSETLINTNQNQLNTETGSFIELIKSTQQGKEAITTALVNKGINATSDQTLTSMAGAIDNLVVSDLQVWRGNIADQTVGNTIDSSMPFCKVIENEWGRWGFYWNDNSDNISSIIIYNISDYVLSSVSTYAGLTSKSFDINKLSYSYAGTSHALPFAPLFYFSDDGTELYYLGDDRQSIYVYSIDYSGSSSSIPLDNISVTLSRTLQLSSALSYPTSVGSRGCGVYYVDKVNKIILLGAYSSNYLDYSSYSNGLCPFNSQTATTQKVNQVYKVVYNNTSGDETGLTATAFTNLNTMPSTGVTTPFFMSSDKCIICNNSSIYLIAVDIANATFKWYGQSAETYTGNAYHSLTFQNNKFIANIKDETPNNRDIKETLTLVSNLPDDNLSGTIQEFNLGVYTKPIFYIDNTYAGLSGSDSISAKTINKGNLIGGFVKGSFWKLSIKDSRLIAKPISALITTRNTNSSAVSIKSGITCGESIYLEDVNFWVAINSSNAYKLVTFLEDQFVGLSYKGQNGTEVYYSPQVYYTDGTLTIESPELLVEDN